MNTPDSAEHFPNADPRVFLEGHVATQREQAETIEPGGPQLRVNEFETFCERFIEGRMPAETLCLYSMLVYASNKDKLQGTKASEVLATFPDNFRRYVFIDAQDIEYLRESAGLEVARKSR